MTYIIVLNWNGAKDTICCLSSLLALERTKNFRIVICDNFSTDNSYNTIRDWLCNPGNALSQNHSLVELTKNEAEAYLDDRKKNDIFLIQTGNNLGFAGGNNVGIRFAQRQANMEYVWVLNNDTEVKPNSLVELVKKCSEDPTIGLCGSRLIYAHDHKKMQGLGGIYNSWLCTTKHYAAYEPSDSLIDERFAESQIDYIIGASILMTKAFIEKVGIFCEDYFLYYEELDLCFRGQTHFKIGIASNSHVIHKEGASTNSGKSEISEYYKIRNRLLFTKKFNKHKLPIVWSSLILVSLIRLYRKQPEKAKNIIRIMFSSTSRKHHSHV
ncbi:glycosyltransferase family 2 protein [Pseudomonas sp. ML2-2023-3]|uniref:glycosyltransferase family 2 protein n=1 Tax=Pseudomonas sp. ML2-2023-3 TaxID=3122375 RepID=UPI0030CC4E05